MSRSIRIVRSMSPSLWGALVSISGSLSFVATAHLNESQPLGLPTLRMRATACERHVILAGKEGLLSSGERNLSTGLYREALSSGVGSQSDDTGRRGRFSWNGAD